MFCSKDKLSGLKIVDIGLYDNLFRKQKKMSFSKVGRILKKKKLERCIVI